MTDETNPIRLIKKYPNRRLYDTGNSCYITLQDVRQMVMNDSPFKVLDQKTGQNLTRSILLHIILEQENDGETLFTTEVLSEFIRHSSESGRKEFSSYLEASMELFARQQAELVKHMDESIRDSPTDFYMKSTNLDLEEFLKRLFLEILSSDPMV